MLNIHDLERRWLKYKIKSYLPHALSVSGLIVLIVSLFLYLPNSSDVQEPVQLKNTETKQVTAADPVETETVLEKQESKEQVSLDVPQNTQTPLSNSQKPLVLKPSLSFMDNIEDSIDPYVHETLVEEAVVNENQSSQTPVQSPPQVEVMEIESPVQGKTGTLTITRNQSNSDLKDVIRRFKQNKNPALSLFIAKRYYDLGKYQKSYNYALMTNEIDKTIDESWIIFSKSLVKLGQHELAMVTLKSYLKTNKSTAAQVLLKKIESGDFR